MALLGNIIGKTAQFATQVYLARMLGPAEFGLYAFAVIIIRITGMLSPLGLGLGVIRYANIFGQSSQNKLKGVLLQSLFISFVLGLIFGATIYLSSSWFANTVFNKPALEPILKTLSIAVFLAAGLRVAGAATRATQRIHFSVISNEIGLHVSHLLFCLIVIGVLGRGINGAVTARIWSFAFAFLLALVFVFKLYPILFKPDIKAEYSVKEVLTFSLAASWVGVVYAIGTWIDRLLIAYFKSTIDVGIYQAAAQVTFLLAIIPMTLSAILAPMIAKLAAKKDMAQLDALYKVSTKWSIYFSLPFLFVILLTSGNVISAIFGDQYYGGREVMMILSTASVLKLLFGGVSMILMMTGYQNRWVLYTIIMLILDFILNIILIPRFGIIGAAVGRSISGILLNISGLILIKSHLGIWPYDRRYYKGVIASIVTIIVLILIEGLYIVNYQISLIVFLLISLSVFFGVMMLLGLDKEEKEIFQSLLRKITNLQTTR